MSPSIQQRIEEKVRSFANSEIGDWIESHTNIVELERICDALKDNLQEVALKAQEELREEIRVRAAEIQRADNGGCYLCGGPSTHLGTLLASLSPQPVEKPNQKPKEMTLEEKMQAIRIKCIDANDDIMKRPMDFTHRPDGSTLSVCDFEAHTVHLADVLLAMQDKAWAKETLDLIAMYNLRRDDLAKQSPETVEFIHQLLCT